MLLDSAIILILGSVPDLLTNSLPFPLIILLANLMAFLQLTLSIIFLSLTSILSKICGVCLKTLKNLLTLETM